MTRKSPTYKLSDNLDSKSKYFMKEVKIAWDKYVKYYFVNFQKEKVTSQERLYNNALAKYKICTRYLAKIIKSKEKTIEYNKKMVEEDIIQYTIITMLLSGSILEATVQFFLFAYLDDFQKESKYEWKVGNNEINYNIVKEKINETLTDLVKNKTIINKQKKSIINVVNKELSFHKYYNKINNYRLDNLINFCIRSNIFLDSSLFFDNEYNIIKKLSKDEIIKGMRSIQSNRNNIHLFTSQNFCTLEEADKNLETLCLIIDDLGSRISYKNDNYIK